MAAPRKAAPRKAAPRKAAPRRRRPKRVGRAIDEGSFGTELALVIFMIPDEDLDPTRESIAVSEIPAAWAALVGRRDAVLLELLSATVESQTGRRPDPARVQAFLAALATPGHLETVRTSETRPGIGGPSIFPPPRKRDQEG